MSQMMHKYGIEEKAMMGSSATENPQSAFVELLGKQSLVIKKLSNCVGRHQSQHGQDCMDSYDDSYDEQYDDSYDYYEEKNKDYYSAPGSVRMRSHGMVGSQMVGDSQGYMRGRSVLGGPRPGRRGAGGPRRAMRSRGGIAQRSVGKGNPTNKDNLSVYCTACSHLAKNNQDFFNHRNTLAHVRQMSKIQTMPESVRKQVRKVIDAVHAQRSEQKTLMFCDLCDHKLTVPYSDHKNITAHQLRSKAVKAGCVPCKTGPVKTYTEYREHLQTETHMEKFEEYMEEMDAKIALCTQQKDFPPFQEGVPFGCKYVKEMKGYYCKLCRKFLFTLEEKELHSKLQRHFNHVRDEFFNKKRAEPIDMGDYTLPEPQKTEEKEK